MPDLCPNRALMPDDARLFRKEARSEKLTKPGVISKNYMPIKNRQECKIRSLTRAFQKKISTFLNDGESGDIHEREHYKGRIKFK